MNSLADKEADSWVLERYLDEIHWQAIFAEMSWNDLQSALRGRDEVRVWYSIAGLLAAAANISKLLWSEKSPKRAKKLRDRLRVPLKDHPLKGRKLRNHFEHFDERLDTWASSAVPYFNDRSLEPKDRPFARITQVNGQQTADLRTFKEGPLVARFGCECYPLEDIIRAVRELELAASQHV